MDRETAALLEHAAALRRSGRVEAAIAVYLNVLDRQPGLADSWYNLGWLQRQARQFEQALHSYAQSLDRGVRDPQEVHLNRAVILSDHLARHDEAQAELEAALAIMPGYVPALLNLGNLYEDRGQRDEAAKTYRRALEAAPDHALALGRLAGVIEPGSPDADEAVATLRSALSTMRPAAEQADLGFALARLLDGRGDYAKAFEAGDLANRASRTSFSKATGAYDREGHEALIDRLIAAFPRPAERAGPPSPSVFICGLFRSGSTLVDRILAGHDSLASAGELDLIPTLASRIARYPDPVADASDSSLDEWRAFYRAGVAPFARERALITDKRPDNFLHIGLIKTLFPDAKIVHTRRNRLDNLISLHFLHLGPAMPYALDLRDSAHWHCQYERLMNHWKQLYPDDILDVDYDDLVRDPTPVVQRLLAFLGVEWDESVLDFHARESVVKTASVWQVREPLHARSSGRWRHYAEQLTKALGELPEAG